MKDFGRMTWNKEVENSLSKLENNMKDSSIKEWNMDTESIDGQQVIPMWVIFWQIKEKV